MSIPPSAMIANMQQTTPRPTAGSWPAVPAIAIATVCLVATAMAPTSFMSRWAPFLALGVFVLTMLALFVAMLRFPAGSPSPIGFAVGVVSLAAATVIVVLGIALVPGVPEAPISPARALVATISVPSVILVGLMIGRRGRLVGAVRRPLMTLLLLTCALALTAPLATTRVGEELANRMWAEPILLYSIALAVGLLIAWVTGPTARSLPSRRTLYATLTLLIVVSLIMSLRADSAYAYGASWYHMSYFAGVVESLRAGGTILWDTPSQYGIGPPVVSAVMPLESAHASVMVAQAFMLLGTSIVVLYLLSRLTWSLRLFVVVSLGWLTVFYFADPAFIGPHPYPSSSAMRFGPSVVVLCLAWLSTPVGRNGRRTRKWASRVLPVAAALGLWWSTESTVYVTLTIGMYVLTLWILQRISPIHGALFPAPLRIARNTIVVAVAIGLGIGVLVWARSGHLPDLGMFRMYAGAYASGFGALPLAFATPAWLVVTAIGLLASVSVVAGSQRMAPALVVPLLTGAGALLAWMSYFVGRAVPDNVVALLPEISLVVMVCALMVLGSGKALHSDSFDARFVTESMRSGFPQSLGAGAIALVSTLVVAFLANPMLANLPTRWQWISASPAWSAEVAAPIELVSLVGQLPDVGTPRAIAYEGYAGTMQPLPPELSHLVDQEKVWLPSPLGLLEEPVAPEKQEEVLRRYVESVAGEGLWVVDKLQSFPDRVERWKTLLGDYYDCQTVAENERFVASDCKLRSG
ncbi:MAG: hypothetical protein K9G28_10190 [Candidatus Nanopelagicales bacterium]|nr:hypothetical protein [Candidatus Nanopelagicales bacterium]MCF8557894.1 hypothetical protein [Candidatus Nanopelagicales bacterium]